MAVSVLPKARRIGVFGGAFDPPHNAHVALAQAAVAQLQLDALHVIPTGQAWHKARVLSDAVHRSAMAALAFGNLAHVVVDERELQRPGPTFTIDTLQALQGENPGAQLYLIIGADQAAAFMQWHRFGDILKIAIICIADRAHSAGPAGNLPIEDLPGATIERLALPLMDVSATRIRQIASHGAAAEGMAGLVPETIARYISRHRLYGAPPAAS
ncbi:MAG: nicotinate (nicotinamide) nucleotide adenylyltransferase [Polaromonas sp.]|nr:nicotinate (nicotinamide) nucleotide adenylyltransferase [Polaromonas sp.]